MAKTQSTVTTLDQEAPTANAQDQAADTAELHGTNADDQLSGKRVTLTIFPSDSDGGQDAVQVGVNGFMYLIPRGKPCRVPVEVAGVIKNAIVTQYKTGDGGRQIETTVPRYAFQITE